LISIPEPESQIRIDNDPVLLFVDGFLNDSFDGLDDEFRAFMVIQTFFRLLQEKSS